MTKKKHNYSIKNVLTQLILDVFEKNNNIPMNYKQVSGNLNIHDQEAREVIQEILESSERGGPFIQVEKGKYKVKDLRVFVQGKVDMTADGSAFIVIDDEE